MVGRRRPNLPILADPIRFSVSNLPILADPEVAGDLIYNKNFFTVFNTFDDCIVFLQA